METAKKKRNMFKSNNEETRMTSQTISTVSIVDFELARHILGYEQKGVNFSEKSKNNRGKGQNCAIIYKKTGKLFDFI